MKTPVLESFNKVTGLVLESFFNKAGGLQASIFIKKILQHKASIFIKKRLHHWRFHVSIAKFLRNLSRGTLANGSF